MSEDIKRSMQFPRDLYEVLKVEAKKEGLHTSQLIIRALREHFNVPVKIDKEE